MRLFEIENNDDRPDLEKLKKLLLQPITIDVADASYSRGNIALGDIQDVGAGSIHRRRHSRSGDLIEWGFQYFKMMDGQPLRATLHISDKKILKPGESFTDEY